MNWEKVEAWMRNAATHWDSDDNLNSGTLARAACRNFGIYLGFGDPPQPMIELAFNALEYIDNPEQEAQ